MTNVTNIIDSENTTQLKIENDGSINTNINNIEIRDNKNENQNELAVNLRGHICSENTTSIPLEANEVFTGIWQDTLDYGTIVIAIFSDKNSATDGLKIEWSSNGIDVIQDDEFTIIANRGKVFTFGAANKYIRIKYTNGNEAQTKFDIQTILRRVYLKPSSHRIKDSIVADDDAELVKSVLTGQNPAGTFVNFQSTTQGNFKVSLEELENNISDDSNTKLKVVPYTIDEFSNISRLLGDNIFNGAIVAIPPEHHEIHCGDSYEVSYTGDLANGASVVFSVIVPNEAVKLFHMKHEIDTEAEAIIQIHKDVILSNNGTPITIFNRNHNSGLTDYLGFNITPTITSAGTLFYQKRIGGARAIGGTAGRENEFILKNNSKYTITITNATATNNYYNIILDYYVHPGV